MRRWLSITFAGACIACAACVDVPDSIRANFAGPSPIERSNYRPGKHGSAPPVESPPDPAEPKVEAPASDAGASDAGASTDVDGGVS